MFYRKYNPSVTFGDSSLCTREPFAAAEYLQPPSSREGDRLRWKEFFLTPSSSVASRQPLPEGAFAPSAEHPY